MTTPRQNEEGFALIERAAVLGARAPTNWSMDNPTGVLPSGVTSALVKEGRVRIEVYAKNWRVIEILKGPNAGKRTMECPYNGAKPYKIVPPLPAREPEGR